MSSHYVRLRWEAKNFDQACRWQAELREKGARVTRIRLQNLPSTINPPFDVTIAVPAARVDAVLGRRPSAEEILPPLDFEGVMADREYCAQITSIRETERALALSPEDPGLADMLADQVERLDMASGFRYTRGCLSSEQIQAIERSVADLYMPENAPDVPQAFLAPAQAPSS